MKNVHKWLKLILCSAMLVLLVSCATVLPNKKYIPNDISVQNISVEDAAKVFLSEINMTHVFVDNQWRLTKKLLINHDRFIVTDEAGKDSIFLFSKLPQISGSNHQIELAGQPTFRILPLDPAPVVNALYVLKQNAIKNEKDADEMFFRLVKLYKGELGGIGLSLKMQDDIPIVDAVSEDAPASGAGVKVGDKISRIGDKPTKGLKLNEVVNLATGNPGTVVMISIVRNGFDTPKEITLTRATIKFVFSEDARKYKVQAEGAVRDKKFNDAANLYGEALKVAPWWPEGHFNRALVLSETGDYDTAMREMKHYLQLAPDAPNARAAQDKIYDWERRASK